MDAKEAVEGAADLSRERLQGLEVNLRGHLQDSPQGVEPVRVLLPGDGVPGVLEVQEKAL